MKNHIIVGLAVLLGATATRAQEAEVILTGTSVNVAESGSPVRIRIFRWSTDKDRERLIAALSIPPAPAPAAAAAGDRGGAARGGRAGGRGGRGGRGDAAPLTPTAALTAAIGSAPTIGYIWTNDITGYSIKYAYRTSLPDGGERIVLATDRQFGAHTAGWQPVAVTPPGADASSPAAVTDYEFTLIEIRLDSKGTGEAKTSRTTRAIVDNEARTVALENYAATPAIFRNVKR
jgi:hypothetical protein